jgi:beta propeller repeat protein
MNSNHILKTLVFLLLQVTTTTFADFPVFTIAPSGTWGSWPQISGNTVVWGKNERGDEGEITGEIDVYNLNTKATTVINAPDNDGMPGIDNDIVVWTQSSTQGSNVYGYRISTGQQFTVSSANSNKAFARISGNTVVWSDDRNGNAVYGYDIATETEFPICVHPGSSRGLAVVSGNYVAWQDERNLGGPSDVDIYGFNLQTKTEFQLCAARGWQGDCGIGNNFAAWTDLRDNHVNIYACNILTQTEYKIATGPGDRNGSAISGNYLVWFDERNGNRDIYGYDLSAHKEFAICTAPGRQSWPSISGNTVVWWEDDGGIYGAVIPEPATLLLLGLGAVMFRRKR